MRTGFRQVTRRAQGARPLALTGVLAAALPTAATAQSIPIVNAGFETPVQAPGGFTVGELPGWAAVGGSGSYGVFYPTVPLWGFVAPGGTQVFYTNGTTVEQTLTTLTQAGKTYVLRMDVVNRPNFGGHNYFVELYAGPTLLTRDANSLSPAVGGFLTSTLSYTIPASGPLVGQPLKIRLGGANQTDMDNVRMTTCYANCDGSTAAPILNVQDFTCFLQQFAAGLPYANCDGSTAAPALNVQDFSCFLQRFAAGCS
jgi:hypothetical protein